MKSVNKFKTFEELKSHKSGAVNSELSKKNHAAFEEFIKILQSAPRVSGKSK